MTVTPLIVYLIGILDKFHFFLGIVLIFLTIFMSLFAIFYLVNHLEPTFADDLKCIQKLVPLVKRGLAVLSILLLLKIFVPSTGLVAAMYVIPAVVNNEKVQNIGSNLLNTLQGLSNKWMIDVFNGIEIDEKELKKNGNTAREKDRSI